MIRRIAVEIEKILQLDHFLLKEIIFEIFTFGNLCVTCFCFFRRLDLPQSPVTSTFTVFQYFQLYS